MQTMIAFNSVVVLLMTSSTCSYHLQCPVKSQRPLRASAYCTRSLRSEYMCLFDTNKLLFSEQCNKNQDYATRGEKYVLSGSLRNVDCSSDRYQPFTLWSNVSGECLYEKTLCEGEGQIIFSNGSLISDRTCRCDYTKGYTFIQQPTQNCFCIPYVEDCSCYIRTCDVGFTLSSDYECVGENNYNNSECPALDKKRGSWRSQIITRNTDGDVQMGFNKSDFFKVVVPGFVVCPFMLLVIVITGKLWHPHPRKMLLVLLLFAALFSSFIIVIKHVEQDLNTVAVGVSVLVITTILSIVYMLFLIYTHLLTQPPEVYDEYYELQIYKLLKAASTGDTIKLKRIIHQKYIDINDTNYDTRSALHLAACGGHFHEVAYLLKKKAGYLDRKDRCLGHTPAEDAAWHERRNDNNASKPNLKRIIDLLNKQKGLQKYKRSFKDSIVLKIIKAAEYGEILVLQSLHDKGTDMNLSDNDGRTALHAAVERNQEKVVEFLIDKCKVSPFQRWRNQRPGDLIKSQFCNPKISEKMRKYTMTENVEQTAKSKEEDKDLQIVRILNSALRGDISLIKAYHTAGYDMTVSDYDKRTALHIAVKNNQEHVVEYLMKECGLTEEAKDRWNITPLEAAKKGGNEIILKLFNTSLPNTVTDEKKEFRLLIAGVDNDVETLKRLHENGWSMNFTNSIGTTVWNVDAYEWNNDAIQYLTNKSKDNNNKHKCAIVTCKTKIF